jgi:hypothetical protein
MGKVCAKSAAKNPSSKQDTRRKENVQGRSSRLLKDLTFEKDKSNTDGLQDFRI